MSLKSITPEEDRPLPDGQWPEGVEVGYLVAGEGGSKFLLDVDDWIEAVAVVRVDVQSGTWWLDFRYKPPFGQIFKGGVWDCGYDVRLTFSHAPPTWRWGTLEEDCVSYAGLLPEGYRGVSIFTPVVAWCWRDDLSTFELELPWPLVVWYFSGVLGKDTTRLIVDFWVHMECKPQWKVWYVTGLWLYPMNSEVDPLMDWILENRVVFRPVHYLESNG